MQLSSLHERRSKERIYEVTWRDKGRQTQEEKEKEKDRRQDIDAFTVTK